MIKKIFFNFIFLILFAIIAIIAFLATKGYETDKFNNLISSEISKKDQSLSINFDTIKIKFDLPDFNLFLSTTNPKISYQNIVLPVNKLKIYLNFFSLIQSKTTLNSLEIFVGELRISEIKKLIIRSKPSNFKSFILNDITKGNVQGNIFLDFKTDSKIKNFKVNGKVKELNFKVTEKLKVKNSNFNFIADNELILLNSITGKFMDIPVSNGSIEIKTNKEISLKGKVESKIDFNNNQISKLSSGFIDKDFLNNKIELKGSFLNNFSLNFSETLKLNNYKYNLNGNIERGKIIFKDQINSSFFEKDLKNININNSSLNFNLDKKDNSIKIDGTYSFNDDEKKNKFNLSTKISKKGSDTELAIDLKDKIFIELLNYKKNKDKKATIKAKINIDKAKNLKIKNIQYSEGQSQIILNNLKFNKNNKIKSFKEIKIKTLKSNIINNEFKIIYGNKIKIRGSKYDSTNLIEIINRKNKDSLFSLINKEIEINLDNVFTKLSIPLKNFALIGKIEKGKFTKISSKSEFPDNKYLDISLKKDQNKNKKILELYSDLPKPILADYKFFNGIEDGKLFFVSIFDDIESKSNLTINNFKVINAPGFAKLLALADFRGVEDLLRGDGISFEQLEIKISQNKKILKIEELFAVGPSISILMDGYVDNETKITSLRGTMVPARELNKLISKIPVLGSILIPKEIGEGLFGVSFKMKGPPGNIKTSVNPIKTLTPRFITKALEKRKKENSK